MIWQKDNQPFAVGGLVTAEEAGEVRAGTVSAGETDFRGVLWTSDPHTLDAGTYDFLLSYSASEAGSAVELYTDIVAGEENQPERVLARAELSPALSEVSLSLDLRQSLLPLRYRIVYGGGDVQIYGLEGQIWLRPASPIILLNVWGNPPWWV